MYIDVCQIQKEILIQQITYTHTHAHAHAHTHTHKAYLSNHVCDGDGNMGIPQVTSPIFAVCMREKTDIVCVCVCVCVCVHVCTGACV